jgi:hypothetical protein
MRVRNKEIATKNHADFRARMKKMGYRQVSVWVLDCDAPKIRALAEELKNKRPSG